MIDAEENILIDQLAGSAGLQPDAAPVQDGPDLSRELDEDPAMAAAAQQRHQKRIQTTNYKKKSPEELFAEYDVDGSGGIDFDEFRSMLPDLGITLSEAKAFKYFRQCDTSGDGEIDLAEFKVALFIVDPSSGNNVGFQPNSLLGPRDAFDLFDEDRSGTLDEDEFSLALEYMKMPVSDGKLEMLFAKYDADGSGSIEYSEFRQAWLGLADPKKELAARGIQFNKYAPPFQLRKQLNDVIVDEEEAEAHAQAVAETWKQFQKDKIQKEADAHGALKRASDELCNALDAAGQVYIFGTGSHGQFTGNGVEPSRVFQHFEHVRRLFVERVVPTEGRNRPESESSASDAKPTSNAAGARSGDVMARDHTGKMVLTGSLRDQQSPFDGLVCAPLGAALWARGVTQVGVGENTAFALTKYGEIIGFGGRDHLWDDVLPGSRWAREDRGTMTQRSQVLLGVKGKMAWHENRMRKHVKRAKRVRMDALESGTSRSVGLSVEHRETTSSDDDDDDLWFLKMKRCAEYFGVYEPPPPDSRKDFMTNVILARIEFNTVQVSLAVRLKKTKDRNKNQLLLALYEDLEFEAREIGTRTQKKIRALEKQIIDFEAQRKTARAQRLRKQISDDYWKALLDRQQRHKAAAERKRAEAVEAEYQRGEQRYRVWLSRTASAQADTMEFSPRTGKSNIQVAGATQRGPGPKIVNAGGQCTSISVGAHHVCAVSRTFALYSWGDNNYGRLGIKGQVKREVASVPSEVPILKGQAVVSVSCGYSHSACIMRDGSLRVWGGSSAGKLGIGDVSEEFECFCEHPIPLPMPGGRRIRQVACGRLHSAAVSVSGDLFMWGSGDGGRLGMGEHDLSNKTTPTLVEYLASMEVRVWRVACGASHTLIATEVTEAVEGSGVVQMKVTKGGDVLQCGATRALGIFAPRFTLVRKLKGRPVKAIAAGDSHSAAVTTEGELYTWGANTNGCAAHPVARRFVRDPTVVQCLHVQSASLCKDKPVSQSSVYNRRGPRSAIDGSTSGDGESQCIHTQRDQCAWWQCDLGRLAVINTIVVWNREDTPIDVSQGEDYFTKRLFPHWLFVATDPFPEGTGNQQLSESASRAVARIKMVKDQRRTVWELPTNTVARYVRIMLEGTNYLHFAQLQVYGTWGLHRSVGRVSDVFCGYQVCSCFSVHYRCCRPASAYPLFFPHLLFFSSNTRRRPQFFSQPCAGLTRSLHTPELCKLTLLRRLSSGSTWNMCPGIKSTGRETQAQANV